MPNEDLLESRQWKQMNILHIFDIHDMLPEIKLSPISVLKLIFFCGQNVPITRDRVRRK